MTIDTTAPRTRRALLAGGLGGLAALAANTIARPAAASAADGQAMVVGGEYDSTSVTAVTNASGDGLLGASFGFGAGVRGESSSGTGVVGTSTSGAGVAGIGTSSTGVAGSSASGLGVYGNSNSGTGIHGSSSSGTEAAVVGRSLGSVTGVLGYSGNGALPAAKPKTGVYGHATQDTNSRGVGSTGSEGSMGRPFQMSPEDAVDQSSPRPVNAPRTCAACGGAELSIVLFASRPVRLGRCEACGLRWHLDPPTESDLAELYSSGFYEPAPARGGALVRELHRLNNAIRLRELNGMEPGRLLDVGCGKGRFLAAATNAGWDAVGIEYAPASAEAARAAYGVEVVVGDFLELDLQGGFDAVTMWHVLEHLPDPVAAVARAGDLVRPGGRIVISVPNIDSLQAHFGGERWFHLDLPRHLYHFTPRSLSALVERAGLRVVRIGHLHPEMEAIGLIQTALNRVGFENDLLYRFAKRDPNAPSGPRVYASLALALAVAPVAVAWSGIAPLLRTGASIQLVAERPM